jgi:hypothetical protein
MPEKEIIKNKTKQNKKELEVWLKWQNIFLASSMT